MPLHRFSAGGVVDFDVVWGWMEDTARGLCHLHTGGVHPILHRDIKPANMLVFGEVAKTRWSRVKLGDLGGSRPLTDGQTHGTAHGTVFTMAPEVPGSGYRTASDVYSWGVTMCCVVAQAMGHVADPMIEYSTDRDGLVRLAVEIIGRHRPHLASLLLRCCETDYNVRPRSSEVLDVVLASQHRSAEAAPQPGPAAAGAGAPSRIDCGTGVATVPSANSQVRPSSSCPVRNPCFEIWRLTGTIVYDSAGFA